MNHESRMNIWTAIFSVVIFVILYSIFLIPSANAACDIGYQSPSTANGCDSCIYSQKPGLVNDIRNLNHDRFDGCSNTELINYWCNGGIGPAATSQCDTLRDGNCKQYCGTGSGTGATCNESQVNISLNPANPQAGQAVTLSVTGDASTHIVDNYNGGLTCTGGDMGWNWVVVDVGGGRKMATSGTRTCTATTVPGTYTWIHQWKRCEFDAFGLCSPYCTKQASFSIGGTPTATPTPLPSATATPTPLPNATSTPTPTPIAYTVTYRVSETAEGLETAPDQPYDNFEHRDPITFSYTFKDQTPGVKWLYVRFISSTGEKKDVRQKILFQPEPKIKSISCGYDSTTGVGTLVTINGLNIGPHDEQGAGSVKINDVDATILSWIMQNVTPTVTVMQATPTPIPTTVFNKSQSASSSSAASSPTPTSSLQQQSTGSSNLLGVSTADEPNTPYKVVAKVPDKLSGKIKVALTTDSGITVTGTCTIGVTTMDFSALSQCREAGSYTLNDVDVSVTEVVAKAKPLVKQKINLNNAGKAEGFAPKLEIGKKYALVLKGPYTLARKIEFTAEEGTTIIPDVTLLVGNIFPVPPDTAINSFDKAELAREWALVEDVTRKGDFNADMRVNSVDYACMRRNIGSQDEVLSLPSE